MARAGPGRERELGGLGRVWPRGLAERQRGGAFRGWHARLEPNWKWGPSLPWSPVYLSRGLELRRHLQVGSEEGRGHKPTGRALGALLRAETVLRQG